MVNIHHQMKLTQKRNNLFLSNSRKTTIYIFISTKLLYQLIMRLFYCTDKSDSTFLIKGDDHRHILKVMRFKVGDAIDIIDGSGWIFKCEISTLTKHELTAQIITQKRASRQ